MKTPSTLLINFNGIDVRNSAVQAKPAKAYFVKLFARGAELTIISLFSIFALKTKGRIHLLLKEYTHSKNRTRKSGTLGVIIRCID